jgi:TfoX/Sxy family transcriptional regulator of competence genes
MTYDEALADRIRAVVQSEPGLSEMRMFGGLAFLVNGNMAVSASSQGGLLLRVDPAETESLVDHEHVRRFEMRGREMNGWLRVDTEAVETEDDLLRWVRQGLTYARSLKPSSRACVAPARSRSGRGRGGVATRRAMVRVTGGPG